MAKDKRRLSVSEALHWAFAVERASLDLIDMREIEDRGFGFGTEYVLLQRLKLGGVKIDTSPGRSFPHDDADLISASVAKLEKLRHGRSLAIAVAVYARSLSTPDWMPGAVPKIEPREWRKGNHLGRSSKTEVLRTSFYWIEIPHPKNPKRVMRRKVKIVEEWCPCTWNPSLQQIESARAEYQEWWRALDLVRIDLQRTALETIEITDAMPPRAPWASRRPVGTRP